MRHVHYLLVDGEADDYLEVIEALRVEGIRVGWLDLRGAEVPAALTSACRTGVLRAVAVDDGVTVSAKPRRGGIVMKDLQREYFLGCSVVLIRGGEGMPRLAARAGRWRLSAPGEPPRTLDTARLVKLLRRPHPFGA